MIENIIEEILDQDHKIKNIAKKINIVEVKVEIKKIKKIEKGHIVGKNIVKKKIKTDICYFIIFFVYFIFIIFY